MTVHELTEEEREQMIDQYLSKMQIERKHLSKEELEKEITDYLSKKHPCSLATCGKDGVPRVSVVDYINDGPVIYILSEGGEKFKNIKILFPIRDPVNPILSAIDPFCIFAYYFRKP